MHTRDKYINPQVFKNTIGGLNPLFEGNQAADAKDLIFFIIETLHKELLPPPIINRNEIDFFQQEMNSNNEQIVFQNFIIGESNYRFKYFLWCNTHCNGM